MTLRRLGWIGWALLLAFAIVLVLAAGCSSSFSGVCGVQGIGEDENGIAYYRFICRPE